VVYTGGFTGYIKFVGLTARNVYSLEGTALDLIGSPESNILVEEGFGFANRATLELKAAFLNFIYSSSSIVINGYSDGLTLKPEFRW
jgi:hypothetical protein